MHQVPSGPWIYFSPDNTLSALINVDHKDVLIIMERYSKTVIYENREKIKVAALRTKMLKWEPVDARVLI